MSSSENHQPPSEDTTAQQRERSYIDVDEDDNNNSSSELIPPTTVATATATTTTATDDNNTNDNNAQSEIINNTDAAETHNDNQNQNEDAAANTDEGVINFDDDHDEEDSDDYDDDEDDDEEEAASQASTIEHSGSDDDDANKDRNETVHQKSDDNNNDDDAAAPSSTVVLDHQNHTAALDSTSSSSAKRVEFEKKANSDIVISDFIELPSQGENTETSAEDAAPSSHADQRATFDKFSVNDEQVHFLPKSHVVVLGLTIRNLVEQYHSSENKNSFTIPFTTLAENISNQLSMTSCVLRIGTVRSTIASLRCLSFLTQLDDFCRKDPQKNHHQSDNEVEENKEDNIVDMLLTVNPFKLTCTDFWSSALSSSSPSHHHHQDGDASNNNTDSVVTLMSLIPPKLRKESLTSKADVLEFYHALQQKIIRETGLAINSPSSMYPAMKKQVSDHEEACFDEGSNSEDTGMKKSLLMNEITSLCCDGSRFVKENSSALQKLLESDSKNAELFKHLLQTGQIARYQACLTTSSSSSGNGAEVVYHHQLQHDDDDNHSPCLFINIPQLYDEKEENQRRFNETFFQRTLSEQTPSVVSLFALSSFRRDVDLVLGGCLRGSNNRRVLSYAPETYLIECLVNERGWKNRAVIRKLLDELIHEHEYLIYVPPAPKFAPYKFNRTVLCDNKFIGRNFTGEEIDEEEREHDDDEKHHDHSVAAPIVDTSSAATDNNDGNKNTLHHQYGSELTFDQKKFLLWTTKRINNSTDGIQKGSVVANAQKELKWNAERIRNACDALIQSGFMNQTRRNSSIYFTIPRRHLALKVNPNESSSPLMNNEEKDHHQNDNDNVIYLAPGSSEARVYEILSQRVSKAETGTDESGLISLISQSLRGDVETAKRSITKLINRRIFYRGNVFNKSLNRKLPHLFVFKRRGSSPVKVVIGYPPTTTATNTTLQQGNNDDAASEAHHASEDAVVASYWENELAFAIKAVLMSPGTAPTVNNQTPMLIREIADQLKSNPRYRSSRSNVRNFIVTGVEKGFFENCAPRSSRKPIYRLTAKALATMPQSFTTTDDAAVGASSFSNNSNSRAASGTFEAFSQDLLQVLPPEGLEKSFLIPTLMKKGWEKEKARGFLQRSAKERTIREMQHPLKRNESGAGATWILFSNYFDAFKSRDLASMGNDSLFAKFRPFVDDAGRNSYNNKRSIINRFCIHLDSVYSFRCLECMVEFWISRGWLTESSGSLSVAVAAYTNNNNNLSVDGGASGIAPNPAVDMMMITNNRPSVDHHERQQTSSSRQNQNNTSASAIRDRLRDLIRSTSMCRNLRRDEEDFILVLLIELELNSHVNIDSKTKQRMIHSKRFMTSGALGKLSFPQSQLDDILDYLIRKKFLFTTKTGFLRVSDSLHKELQRSSGAATEQSAGTRRGRSPPSSSNHHQQQQFAPPPGFVPPPHQQQQQSTIIHAPPSSSSSSSMPPPQQQQQQYYYPPAPYGGSQPPPAVVYYPPPPQQQQQQQVYYDSAGRPVVFYPPPPPQQGQQQAYYYPAPPHQAVPPSSAPPPPPHPPSSASPSRQRPSAQPAVSSSMAPTTTTVRRSCIQVPPPALIKDGKVVVRPNPARLILAPPPIRNVVRK